MSFPPTAPLVAPGADPTLRLYAILRGDLGMRPGKAAAQAGHAYLEAFLVAQREQADIAARYAADPPGTKICLEAPDLEALERTYALARAAGIPAALIEDAGHVIPGTAFTGAPLVTALGLGPATRATIARLTRSFALVR